MQLNSELEIFDSTVLIQTGPSRNDFSDDPEAAEEPLEMSDEELVCLVWQLKELLNVGGTHASFARSALQFYERREYLTALQVYWAIFYRFEEYRISEVA